MRSHEMAELMLAMPDGHVTVNYPIDVQPDEIPPSVVVSITESIYSGEPAVELEME